MRIVRMRESGGVLGQPAVIGSYPVAATDISALLRFSPDGKLYVGIGTGSNPRDAQDLAAPSGKILRLRDDGTTPDDNPTSSPVLSAGHRDPRGLAWLPQDQSLWEVERNEQGDELNRIHSGANYGWPLREERQQNANVMAPVFVLRSGSEPSGMTTVVLPGSPLFGDLIVSTLAGRDLLRFRLTDALQPQLSGRLLQGRFGRIAQVASGTDGALYFVTANQEEWGMGQDVLVRVRPHTRRQPKPLN
jgi:glucose/arabinose dehydrogenase